MTRPQRVTDAATAPEARDRPDLDAVEHIRELVRRFYGEVDTDPVLGPIFNDVAGVDWEEHLPKLTAFWSRALLGIEGYVGNPYATHAAVHQASPLRPEHFARWIDLFESTLDAGWRGPLTERARTLARNVARVHASQLGVVSTPR